MRCLIWSALFVIGFVRSCMISLANFPPSSVTPWNDELKIPIMSAVICFAESLRNTPKISAIDEVNPPTIVAISDPISNILIR